MARQRENVEMYGIEVERDEDTLWLSCEPDSYSEFRDFIQEKLKDIPGIPWEQMKTIEISDAATRVARSKSPFSFLVAGCMVIAAFFVVMPWALGIGQIVRRLIRWISN